LNEKRYGTETLLAFVALADELDFGRTAQRLCIAQPAPFMQMKGLEKSWESDCSERDRHKIALSETAVRSSVMHLPAHLRSQRQRD
jgi:DNA-binding transcriptional LysR family regulator